MLIIGNIIIFFAGAVAGWAFPKVVGQIVGLFKKEVKKVKRSKK